MVNISKDDFNFKYWRYYLLLEKRFIDTLDYATLAIENYRTFSDEYSLLIQAIGAELDNVFKTYCHFASSEKKNIGDYANYILAHYPNITMQKIRIPEFRIDIQPFLGWDITRPKQSLQWWTSFDNIKHSRTDNRSEANQENVLNILGALFLIERKMLQEIVVGDGTQRITVSDLPDPKSNLFSLANTGWVTKLLVAALEASVCDRTDCD